MNTLRPGTASGGRTAVAETLSYAGESGTAGTLRDYARAVRAFSFTASFMPVLTGALVTLSYGADVRWGLFPLVALAAVLFHAGTNLVSDAGDFERGVDREGTHGGSGVLVSGRLRPGQVRLAGLAMFAGGSCIGLVLVWLQGMPVLWLGLTGLLGGFFYGGRRFGYKYLALGDPLVFVLMGPLMVIGSYYVLTGTFDMKALYFSLPIGCLVTAILSSNNLRDITSDTFAGVRTFANVFGISAAKAEYLALVGGAYVTVVVLVVCGLAGPLCLIVAFSLPMAAKNITLVLRTRVEDTGEIATIDVRTAQLHLLFGLLLCVGLFLSWLT